ncbi:hypothetical protein ACGH2B_01865 [Streptomyces sp. BBFR2]|uniref:hypothetical protein n=1 Tax=Streptomyces sp. BBFR2 TaxID=3372854 RepID=UPI0037D9BCCE
MSHLSKAPASAAAPGPGVRQPWTGATGQGPAVAVPRPDQGPHHPVTTATFPPGGPPGRTHGTPDGRPIDGGVVFEPGGEPLEPSQLAPWWRPDRNLYTVFVRFDDHLGAFYIASRPVTPLELAERVLACPRRSGRAVLLVSNGSVAGWMVQQIADRLQMPVLAGGHRDRWWGVTPQRADRHRTPAVQLAGRHPFPEAELARLRPGTEPPRDLPGPAPLARPDARGLVLAERSAPETAALTADLGHWAEQRWRPGLYGVAVHRPAGHRGAPYLLGTRPASVWDLARALWTVRTHWQGRAAALAVLTSPPPPAPDGARELRLLAAYLRTSVVDARDPAACAALPPATFPATSAVVPATAGAGGGAASPVTVPVPVAEASPVPVPASASGPVPVAAMPSPVAAAPPSPAASGVSASPFVPGPGPGPGRVPGPGLGVAASPVPVPSPVPGTPPVPVPVPGAPSPVPGAPSPVAGDSPPPAGPGAAAPLPAPVAAAPLTVPPVPPAVAPPTPTPTAPTAPGATAWAAPGTPAPAPPSAPALPPAQAPGLGAPPLAPDVLAAPGTTAWAGTPAPAPPSAPAPPPAPAPGPGAPPPAPDVLAAPVPPVLPRAATPPPPPALGTLPAAVAGLPAAVGVTPPVAAAPRPPAPPADGPATPEAPRRTDAEPRQDEPRQDEQRQEGPPATGPAPLGPGPEPVPADAGPAAPEPATAPGPPRRAGVLYAPAGVLPAHRSTADERAALRAALRRGYDVHARAVARVLATRPGLRSAADAGDSVLCDLIAVRALICDDWQAAGPGRLPSAQLAGAWAACVASGLRRLPSYRGVAHGRDTPAQEGADGYRTGQLLRPAEVVRARRGAPEPGDTGVTYAVWSVSGRRTDALGTAGAGEEVLFPGNSAFRVLATGPDTGPGPRLLLRELTAAEYDAPDAERQPDALAVELDERDAAVRDKLLAACRAG